VSAGWFGPRDGGDEQPWQLYAECHTADLALFFPEGRTLTSVERQVEAAKSVCARCGVRVACLRYAQDNQEQWGVWGGVDFEAPAREYRREERRRLKQRRAQRSAA
jgi:WhiB family redox-sensing transcriptional regulator